MTPATWRDVEDDIATAVQATEQAVAGHSTLPSVPAAFRRDRELAIGKDVHDAYSAAERALQRIITAVDDNMPAVGRFHRDLLDRAARPEAGRRPAIVTTETVEGLIALMRFRHAFRHVYQGFEFARASENVEVAATTIPRLRDEITAFAASLGLVPRA